MEDSAYPTPSVSFREKGQSREALAAPECSGEEIALRGVTWEGRGLSSYGKRKAD